MRTIDANPQEIYVEELYAPEDPGLRLIRERLVNAGRWGVNISSREGKILQIFMRLITAERVVEIGTLFGYSGVWLARALPPQGHLYTIERDHECVRMAKKAFADCKVEHQITVLEGEASVKLEELKEKGPFDLIFIDANKSAYLDYLEWSAQNLRQGGLIIADNTLLGGGVAHERKPENLSTRQWEGMRAFNRALADTSRFNSMLFPTTEGLSVAIKL